MATTIIYQRTRDNQVVEQFPVLTTNTVCRGLEFDGHYLWASAGGEIVQIDPRPRAVLKTITQSPVETFDDIAFDGEYLWGPVSGNAGIGQLTREGNRVNLIGSITSQSPTGMAFDGNYLWGHYIDIFGSGVILFQTDRQPQSVHKAYTISLPLEGLTFDGEFLVAQTLVSGTRDLIYIDRETGTIVRRVTGEVTGADAHGICFDGEFFYTMLSV